MSRTASLSPEDGFKLLTTGTLSSYEAMLTSDYLVEGPRAFTEKRPPRWQGR